MSVKNKLFFLIALLMGVMAIFMNIFSEVYFKNYYVNIEKKKLLEVSREIKSEGIGIDLGEIENKNHVKIDLLPVDFFKERKNFKKDFLNKSSNRRPDFLYQKKFFKKDFLSEADLESLLGDHEKFLYKTPKDREFGGESLILVTAYDNSMFIAVGVPISVIKEPVGILTDYYLKIIIVSFIIGVVLARILSSMLTKPLVEIEEVAKRVAALDFSKQFSGKQKDEIGVLGESINQMSRQLEGSIGELKLAKEDLEKANRKLLEDIEKERKIEEMRKEFISNVSHELKTPIAVISNYVEGIKEGVASDKLTQNFYLDVIQEETESMDKLVKSLLFLSQLERDYIDIKSESFNLGKIIKKEMEVVSVLAEKKSAKVGWEIDDSFIKGDQEKLGIVVRNLVGNAVKYVSENGNVTAKYLGKRFEIYNSCDTIEEDLDKLWLPFYRGDKARKRAGGTGLGLSMVKEILEKHGYMYGVKKEKRGMLFWFEGKEG